MRNFILFHFIFIFLSLFIKYSTLSLVCVCVYVCVTCTANGITKHFQLEMNCMQHIDRCTKASKAWPTLRAGSSNRSCPKCNYVEKVFDHYFRSSHTLRCIWMAAYAKVHLVPVRNRSLLFLHCIDVTMFVVHQFHAILLTHIRRR